jgi:hypothetical protein
MQAGRHALFRRAAKRSIGASRPRFPSLFDVEGEYSRAATHVDARDGVLSDAGSTPAASIRLTCHLAFGEATGSLMASHFDSPFHLAFGEATGSLMASHFDMSNALSERSESKGALDQPPPTMRSSRACGTFTFSGVRTIPSTSARRTTSIGA